MKLKISLALSLALLLTSCYTVKQTSSQYERLPIKVSENPKKEGRSCAVFSLPFSIFYYNADFTVEAARKNGEINQIISIEDEFSRGVGYVKRCTVVKGN